MAIKVRSASEIAQKYASVTPGRQSYYEAGTEGAGDDWARNTQAAAANYKAAVSAGDIDKRFSGGVRRAGGAKYERKVKAVGGSRYSSGVTAGVEDYQAGIEPYLQVLSGLTLPPRSPRGSDANDARFVMVRKALAAKRIALKTAGG